MPVAPRVDCCLLAEGTGRHQSRLQTIYSSDLRVGLPDARRSASCDDLNTMPKFFSTAVASGLAFALSWCAASPAGATTLNFDTIATAADCNASGNTYLGGIPPGYGGLLWAPHFQLECNADYMANFGNSYGAPSPDWAAYNGLALGESDVTIASGTFTFNGAAFSSFAVSNGLTPFSAPSLAINGYRPGDLVGSPTFTTAFDLDPTQYVTHSLNWTGIERLAFLTGSGAVADPGTVYNVDGVSWLMDDMQINAAQPQPVPEPGTLFLLGGGLVVVIRHLRRRP